MIEAIQFSENELKKLFCGLVEACDERSAGSMPLVALMRTSLTSVLVSIDSGARAERGEGGDVVARNLMSTTSVP